MLLNNGLDLSITTTGVGFFDSVYPVCVMPSTPPGKTLPSLAPSSLIHARAHPPRVFASHPNPHPHPYTVASTLFQQGTVYKMLAAIMRPIPELNYVLEICHYSPNNTNGWGACPPREVAYAVGRTGTMVRDARRRPCCMHACSTCFWDLLVHGDACACNCLAGGDHSLDSPRVEVPVRAGRDLGALQVRHGTGAPCIVHQ